MAAPDFFVSGDLAAAPEPASTFTDDDIRSELAAHLQQHDVNEPKSRSAAWSRARSTPSICGARQFPLASASSS